MKFNIPFFQITPFDKAVENNSTEIIQLFQNWIAMKKKENKQIIQKVQGIADFISRDDYFQVFQVKDKYTNYVLSANFHYKFFKYYSVERQKKILENIHKIMQLNHSSLIKYFFFSDIESSSEMKKSQKTKPILFTELIPSLTLSQIIEKERQLAGQTGWNDTKKIISIYGIASGMFYLHLHHILHYDLKTSNITLDDNLYPKIKNHGIANCFDSLKTIFKVIDFSVYSAPEVLLEQELTEKSEVYSFGMIVYEIITNRIPFDNLPQTEFAVRIIECNRPMLNDSIPAIYRNLIERCWSQNPINRPSFAEIVYELQNNKEFIIDTVDSKEYKEYIRHIYETIDVEIIPKKITEVQKLKKKTKRKTKKPMKKGEEEEEEE